MANLKYYLDMSQKNQTFFSLRLAINHKSKSAYITTPIKLLENQWDKKSEKIINHPQAKILNNSLITQKSFYITKLMQLEQEINIFDFSATEIKYLLIDKPNTNDKTVKEVFDENPIIIMKKPFLIKPTIFACCIFNDLHCIIP